MDPRGSAAAVPAGESQRRPGRSRAPATSLAAATPSQTRSPIRPRGAVLRLGARSLIHRRVHLRRDDLGGLRVLARELRICADVIRKE